MKRFLIVLAVLVMAATPALADTQIWAAQQNANTGIVRWDDATGGILGDSTAGSLVAPRGMEYDFAANQMYVSAFTSGVAAYNPDGSFIGYKYTGNITGNGSAFAWDIAMDGTYVYVSQFQGAIHRYLNDGTPAGILGGSVHTTNQVGNNPGGLAYLDGQLYLSYAGSPIVRVFNAATGAVVGDIDIPQNASMIESANGKLYFQANNGSNLYVMNGDGTGIAAVVTNASSGGELASASYFGISPDGTRAAVTISGVVLREFSLVDGSFIRQLNPNTFEGVAAVGYTPEPASLALLGLGGLMMLRRRRA